MFAVAKPAADFICAAKQIPGWQDVYFYVPSPVGAGFLSLLDEDCASNVFLTAVFPDPTNASIPMIAEFQASLQRSYSGEQAAPTYEKLEGWIAGRLAHAALERLGEGLDAFTGQEGATYEAGRALARSRLMKSVFETGMFSFEGFRLGPYGPECSVSTGSRVIGCDCSQGMHSVYLLSVQQSRPYLNQAGDVVRDTFFQREPDRDLFFESCGVSIDYLQPSLRPIVFGQSASFSGDTAGLGRGLEHGIRAAFEHANRLGGVNGKMVRLLSFDDAYQPATTIANTLSIMDAHQVFALIGYAGTPTASAVFDLINERQIPFVGPLTGAGFLRATDQNRIINVRASYADECAAMVKYLKANGHQRVAFFGQADGFGAAGYNGLRAALRYHRMELHSAGYYPKGTTAVHQGVLDILSMETLPDSVVMFGTARPLAAFSALLKIGSVRGLDLSRFRIIAVSFAGSIAFRDALIEAVNGITNQPPADYLNNVYMTQVAPVPTDTSNPIVQEFQQDLQDAYGSGNTLQTFESLEGWMVGRSAVMALQRSASTTREAFVDAFYSTQFFSMAQGTQPLGPFQLDNCNQGSRVVYVSEMGPDPAVDSADPGSFSIVDTYDFSGLDCGVTREYGDHTCEDGWERVSLSEDTIQYRCDRCVRGQASSGGAPCEVCPAGYYSPEDGEAECIPCPPGYYQDRPGQGSCLPCDIYSYASGTNHTSCTPCGENALAFFEASVSRDQCVCSGGYYGDPRLAVGDGDGGAEDGSEAAGNGSSS